MFWHIIRASCQLTLECSENVCACVWLCAAAHLSLGLPAMSQAGMVCHAYSAARCFCWLARLLMRSTSFNSPSHFNGCIGWELVNGCLRCRQCRALSHCMSLRLLPALCCFISSSSPSCGLAASGSAVCVAAPESKWLRAKKRLSCCNAR